jgi:hypothetical protein
MLSSVLHSARAIQVNIAIKRTFVQLREMIGSGRNNGVRRGEPARQWLVGMLACRSCVSAVAVEALMNNVREEGKLELTEGVRA